MILISIEMNFETPMMYNLNYENLKTEILKENDWNGQLTWLPLPWSVIFSSSSARTRATFLTRVELTGLIDEPPSTDPVTTGRTQLGPVDPSVVSAWRFDATAWHGLRFAACFLARARIACVINWYQR